MSHRIIYAVLVAGGLLPGRAAITLAVQSTTPRLAFTNISVVDVNAGIVRPNMLVVMEGDRIMRVERYRAGAVVARARAIAGDGKFLMPGLSDMHVHAYDEPELALFIANGVTGVRQMSGTKVHHEWAPRLASGDLIGPRQVIASPIIDGPKPVWPGSLAVANAAEARAAVDRVRSDGAEFVKIYSLLPRDAYFAIAEHTKKLGVPFAGHLPVMVTLTEAIEAGQASVEHMTDVIFAASSREDEFRRELLDAADGDLVYAPVRQKQAAAALASYDPAKADRLFSAIARSRMTMVPTLVLERALAYLDDRAFTSDPGVKYTPRRRVQQWDPARDFRLRDRKPEDWTLQKQAFTKKVEAVAAMHRRGVRLLAGTDMGNPFCFPGFSLHDELALFVDAGMTPLDALRTATVNPARFLGRTASSGSIDVGKVADAVLLDANPLTDVRNTRKIEGVVSRGRYFDRSGLDALLASAERWANLVSITETLAPIIRDRGVGAAIKEYQRLKRTAPGTYNFDEDELNTLGYLLLGDKHLDDAIQIFELNVKMFPSSSNAYDSLGEAYMAKGDRERAIHNYERSLQLDPSNANAVAQLQKLRAATQW